MVDAATSLQSYEAMLRLMPGIEHAIPGHDLLDWEFYPAIVVKGIELPLLHTVPKPHSGRDLATLRTLAGTQADGQAVGA
jgi:hypothetical protein